MRITVEPKATHDMVRIDLTDEDAANASAVGRSAQERFAFRAAHLAMGDPFNEHNATVYYIRGKRGVANRGFVALVRMDR